MLVQRRPRAGNRPVEVDKSFYKKFLEDWDETKAVKRTYRPNTEDLQAYIRGL